MQIRAATPDDAPAIAAMLGHLGYPTDAAAVPARLAAVTGAGGALLLAWEEGGAPVGLVGFQSYPVIHAAGRVAHITALVVAPSAQGRGVGRALVAAAELLARDAGCVRLAVTSAEHREGAHAFYPRVGLPYTGRRYSRALEERAATDR